MPIKVLARDMNARGMADCMLRVCALPFRVNLAYSLFCPNLLEDTPDITFENGERGGRGGGGEGGLGREGVWEYYHHGTWREYDEGTCSALFDASKSNVRVCVCVCVYVCENLGEDVGVRMF